MTLEVWEYFYRELLWLDKDLARKLDILVRNLIEENKLLKEQGIK
jgi:hypothetical protein